MFRARNSDSKTHQKKWNPTPGTNFRLKSLWCIFFDAPCIFVNICAAPKTSLPHLSVAVMRQMILIDSAWYNEQKYIYQTLLYNNTQRASQISAFNLPQKDRANRVSCWLSSRRPRRTKSPLGSSSPQDHKDPS